MGEIDRLNRFDGDFRPDADHHHQHQHHHQQRNHPHHQHHHPHRHHKRKNTSKPVLLPKRGGSQRWQAFSKPQINRLTCRRSTKQISFGEAMKQAEKVKTSLDWRIGKRIIDRCLLSNLVVSRFPLFSSLRHFLWQQQKMQRPQCSLIFVRLRPQPDYRKGLSVMSPGKTFWGTSAEKSLVTSLWQEHCHARIFLRWNSAISCLSRYSTGLLVQVERVCSTNTGWKQKIWQANTDSPREL